MKKDDDAALTGSAEKKKLTQKELAKKMRHEAYQRAKEFRKTSPREIARKALAKEQRKALYQKAKEHNKAFKDAKKTKPDVSGKIGLAKDLAADERPLAPVIPIDLHKLKQKLQK